MGHLFGNQQRSHDSCCAALFVRQKQSVKNLAKLGVCHPGQSYNPTEDDHDDVLASAVAVELKRQAAIDEERAPISAGMSEETLALIVGDEDDVSPRCLLQPR